MIHDLDEEIFVKEWKDFKSITKNQTQFKIDKLKTQITKKFSIATPPVNKSNNNSIRKYFACI